MSLLRVEGLRTCLLSAAGIVRAVDDVSFDVEAGETFALLGESGCGKSMTALSLMRLLPDAGSIVGGQVLLDGRDLLALSEAEMRDVRGREMAMIFQEPATSLNPVLSVGRQIVEVLERHTPMQGTAARRRALELVDAVGIPDPARRLDEFPFQLSGGMKQRVMIAMALAGDPRLLIADEPTTALDVTIQAQIVDLTRRLQDELGMAIIWITHDLGVVAGMADRVLVMYSGFIVEEGNVNDLYAHPRHPYTLGLLRSIPRLDLGRQKRLIPIDGLPPDLLEPPTHCPFAPRCAFVQEKCWQENPALVEVTPGHKAACWVDISGVPVLQVAEAEGAVS